MWPITMLNHTNKQINIPGTEKCLFFYLFWAPYARTTRYEEAYLPEGKKRPRSLRSLGLASLLILVVSFVLFPVRGFVG